MTQANLFDPGAVNGATDPSCDCSGTPHTSACRLTKWARRRVEAYNYSRSKLPAYINLNPKASFIVPEETLACGVASQPQAPELKRQAAAKALILGRLQDGPALAAELVACGGGYRYSARLHELRQAGHNITTENLGDGLFRYTLVLP